jgi:NTE family protein
MPTASAREVAATSTSEDGPTFVLGGGGVLGATQVGMLQALLEVGIVPHRILGTSVGALNGVVLAADPQPSAVTKLTSLWTTMSDQDIFAGSLLTRVRTLVRHGTHLHPSEPLAQLLAEQLPVQRIEDLPIDFSCVAASVERATAHWFTAGEIVPAVLASCAVPGLLPPVVVDGQTYLDGGLVDSVPVSRAVQLGAREVYVLHVGRIERSLAPPRRPWEVALVAFEIARRNRFVETMANLPPGITVHVLPSGIGDTPLVTMKYGDVSKVADRIERGYDATRQFLRRLPAHR